MVGSKQRWSWRRRAIIALAVFTLLLAIFHRPVLLGVGHSVVIRLLARESLRADFHVEGTIFTNLVLRDVHVVSTGPSDVESIDADYVRVEYGLFRLIRHGLSTGIKYGEVKSARVVLNPERGRLRPRPPDPTKKLELFDIFPDRVHFVDATVIVRNQPHDFVAEHVDLDLDPQRTGQLKVAKLQWVGGQTWQNFSAPMTYLNHTIALRDVVLAPDERINTLDVDASHIADRKLSLNFDYAAGAGTIAGSIAVREAQSSLDTNVHVRAEKAPIEVLDKYIALPEGWMRGELESFRIDITGLLSAPRTWNGQLTAAINNFQQESVRFDRADFKLATKNGALVLERGDIAQGQNRSSARGSIQLPNDIKQFGREPADIELSARFPDLGEVMAGLPRKAAGAGEIDGKIKVDHGRLDGAFTLAGEKLKWADGSAEKLNGTLTVSKVIPPAGSNKPWFSDLHSEASLMLTSGRFREYGFDSSEMNIRGADDLVTVERFIVKRKQNELTIRGDYRLPKDFAQAATQPATVEVSWNAPELADYWAADSRDKVSGPVQASAQLQWKNGEANGALSVYGANLRAQNLTIRGVNLQLAVSRNKVYVNDLSAALSGQDFLQATGEFGIEKPFHYKGSVAANVADLSQFKPLLVAIGNKNELAGSLVIDWNGSGQAANYNNSGEMHLTLEKGRYADLKELRAKVEATYAPDGLSVPIIYFGSDRMNFQAVGESNGTTLEIAKIQIDQEGAKYATGSASVPFIWKNVGTAKPVFDPNGKVAITFQSENLDLKKLFDDVGVKAPISGFLNVKVDAKGTLADLVGRMDLQMRELRSTDLPKLEPATLDLLAQAENGQLNVSGKMQQARIQPVQVTANIPFDAARIAREHKIADNTPVHAKVWLPRSSVNFIRQFAPALERIDGEAALDLNLSGTVGAPKFSGDADMTVNVARANNATVPALTNFKARLHFADNALTFEHFGGDLSGGNFSVAGAVRFLKLTDPQIELQIKANSALISRDDNMTVRTDADVRISGPLARANVTGTVALTNSQLLKNIDLIPVGLPGRPPPEPPSSRPDFSFPTPPLRDWKFDVAIKTKDPFRIRGNLASGGAVADLHLIGTGLHPGIDGMVRLDNVEATLPFSRLEIEYGFLHFDPADSLNPRLDLHGKSVIRDYTVHVYIYGTTLAPEAVFTSEPPLPQEEVISLLSTGATREELTGNNSVLAGRAASLLLQQIYHKIFNKNSEASSSSVFNRLDLDVGQVDPRTGERTATARFKVNDQVVLMGDVGVAGGFKGMVKYLIRFR